MNEYQSLLHSLSLNNKGKLIWTASYDSLQRFVEEYLNLREGSWSSPGGDGKLYEAGDVSIKWYANSQTITVYGENKAEVEEKLKSAASVSKDLLSNIVVNTEVSKVHSHQPEASLASSTVNDPLEEFKEFINAKLLALTKEFHANLSIVNKTLLEHSMKLNNFIPQDSERELNTLRKENLELKKENSCLKERINNLSYVLANLQDKAKHAEEKNSLVTTIRLLHNDAKINHPSNNISENVIQPSNEIIQPLNETGQIVNVDINQTTLNQSNTCHVKQVSQGYSSKIATVDDQVTPLPKQIQCNSSRTAKANDQVTPLQNQIQCKSSKTATADDQVIPLQKQMDHPQISLPMQKKDKPCPFIVRRGWCIKGQECDFSHANLVNNLDLRKPVKTRKVRGPKPSSFLGKWQRNNIISLMNRLETSLQEIESTQTLHEPYLPRLPPQPRYLPSRAVYPSPLMETPVYPPFYRRH